VSCLGQNCWLNDGSAGHAVPAETESSVVFAFGGGLSWIWTLAVTPAAGATGDSAADTGCVVRSGEARGRAAPSPTGAAESKEIGANRVSRVSRRGLCSRIQGRRWGAKWCCHQRNTQAYK